jgi:hypothetical protein
MQGELDGRGESYWDCFEIVGGEMHFDIACVVLKDIKGLCFAMDLSNLW